MTFCNNPWNWNACALLLLLIVDGDCWWSSLMLIVDGYCWCLLFILLLLMFIVDGHCCFCWLLSLIFIYLLMSLASCSSPCRVCCLQQWSYLECLFTTIVVCCLQDLLFVVYNNCCLLLVTIRVTTTMVITIVFGTTINSHDQRLFSKAPLNQRTWDGQMQRQHTMYKCTAPGKGGPIIAHRLVYKSSCLT